MNTLSNVMEVAEYLKNQGYRCGKSTLYNHVNEGRLIKNKSGSFDVKQVEKYAGLNLKLIGGESPSNDLEQLQREKLEAETKKAQAQAEHWEHKTRVETGEYIEKELFYGEMAARASILKNDFETFFRSNAGQMIQLCGGDQTKIPDMIDMCLGQVEEFFNRYAEKKVWAVKRPVYEDDHV
jgi:hypothetical protein